MSDTHNNPIPAEIDEILNNEGYEGFVRGLFNRSGDPSKDFAHAVLGLRTEVHELLTCTDPVNAVEEAGDLVFYVEAASQVIEDWAGPNQATEEEWEQMAVAAPAAQFGLHNGPEATCMNALNLLEDIAKRWVGYGRAPSMPPAEIMVTVGAAVYNALSMSTLRGTLNNPNFDLHVKRVNMAKLLKRYQGRTFSAERAVNRDLATERQVLESASAQS